MLPDPQAMRDLTMPPESAEQGFSVIEVIIAMTILALISIAMVPVILTSMQASTQNRAQVAATTYATSELAELRRSFPNDSANSCATVALQAHANQPDLSGSGLASTVEIAGCPTGTSDYPTTVTVTVTVSTTTTPARKLTTLASQILVSAP